MKSELNQVYRLDKVRDGAESELGKGRATVRGHGAGPGDRTHVRRVQD